MFNITSRKSNLGPPATGGPRLLLRSTNVCGAVAANGGAMGNTKEKSATEKEPDTIAGDQPTSPAANSRRVAGRRRGKAKRHPKPGRAGSVLRSSVDLLVIEESVRIAEALVDNAIHGSVAGAKLIADLTGAKNPPKKEPPKKKKRRGLTYAQQLALDPPWVPTTPEEIRKFEVLEAEHRRLNPHLFPA